MKKIMFSLLSVAFLLLSGACNSVNRPDRTPQVKVYEVTGYCRCGSCCGWKRNWYGRPVLKSNPSITKEVGLTASGTKARIGTIAAPRNIPYGTIMHIPGYGYGVVEDRGGAIKGNKLDVYFNSHQDALEWGRQTHRVEVWLPQS